MNSEDIDKLKKDLKAQSEKVDSLLSKLPIDVVRKNSESISLYKKAMKMIETGDIDENIINEINSKYAH
jgi:hypothetical protein